MKTTAVNSQIHFEKKKKIVIKSKKKLEDYRIKASNLEAFKDVLGKGGKSAIITSLFIPNKTASAFFGSWGLLSLAAKYFCDKRYVKIQDAIKIAEKKFRI